MKINKKIKIAAFSILGTVLLLFVVLVAHIALAKPVDNAHLQISRIDFDSPMDAQQVKEIHRNLKSIPGVTNDHFKPESGVVVFWHNNRIADSKKVYDELMAKGNYKAKRFVIPAALASKQVCPVMDPNGLSYKFSAAVQRIFN
ncbi:MAG TPA: hypothetical protein VK528_03955 [Flavobacterium sp.]|nr:hypothetical protein [Flavobacterium sp.]